MPVPRTPEQIKSDLYQQIDAWVKAKFDQIHAATTAHIREWCLSDYLAKLDRETPAHIQLLGEAWGLPRLPRVLCEGGFEAWRETLASKIATAYAAYDLRARGEDMLLADYVLAR